MADPTDIYKASITYTLVVLEEGINWTYADTLTIAEVEAWLALLTSSAYIEETILADTHTI